MRYAEAVAGIVPDVHCDDGANMVFASFGRNTGEPVKIWDARRMDSTLGRGRERRGVVRREAGRAFDRGREFDSGLRYAKSRLEGFSGGSVVHGYGGRWRRRSSR